MFGAFSILLLFMCGVVGWCFVVFVPVFLLLLLFPPFLVFVSILLRDMYVSIHCGGLFVALCVFFVLFLLFVWFAVFFVALLRWCAFLFPPAVFVYAAVLDCLLWFVHVWGRSSLIHFLLCSV